MKNNNNGAFHVARQLFDSEIWLEKPATWLKIWIYILGKVNFKENGKYGRGEGFFMFSKEIHLMGDDITPDKIKKCVIFLKKNAMIDTRRSTRGMIIKVLKYDDFQTIDNYSSTSQSTKKALRKHQTSTPIKEECKNVKNDINKYIATEVAEEVPDLIKDKQKHIQIIGIYARAKKIEFKNKEQQRSFIRRNLRPAKDLCGYEFKEIIATIQYLLQKADFKWTLESVGKFIDEDLEKINNKKNNNLITSVI